MTCFKELVLLDMHKICDDSHFDDLVEDTADDNGVTPSNMTLIEDCTLEGDQGPYSLINVHVSIVMIG